jgi:hypothetical protein
MSMLTSECSGARSASFVGITLVGRSSCSGSEAATSGGSKPV